MNYYKKLRDLVIYRGEKAPDEINDFDIEIFKSDTADMCDENSAMDYTLEMYPYAKVVLYKEENNEWKIRDGYLGPMHMDYRFEEEIISAYILQKLGVINDTVKTYQGWKVDKLEDDLQVLLEDHKDILMIHDLYAPFCLMWNK